MVTALRKISWCSLCITNHWTWDLFCQWNGVIKLAMCGATWSKIQDGNPALDNHLEFLFIYIYACVCVYVYSICMYVWFTCNPAPTSHFVDPSDPRLRTLPQPLELKQQLSFAGTWWKCLGFFPGKAGHKEFWKSLAVDNYQPVPG